jgi:hypothetical protein
MVKGTGGPDSLAKFDSQISNFRGKLVPLIQVLIYWDKIFGILGLIFWNFEIAIFAFSKPENLLFL